MADVEKMVVYHDNYIKTQGIQIKLIWGFTNYNAGISIIIDGVNLQMIAYMSYVGLPFHCIVANYP